MSKEDVKMVSIQAEQIVCEAIESAIARMVMDAEAGRNRVEIGRALEAIQINNGTRKSALKTNNDKTHRGYHVTLTDKAPTVSKQDSEEDFEDTRL